MPQQKSFRVNIYEVVAATEDEDDTPEPFEQAICKAGSQSVEDREKTVRQKLRRLEDSRSGGDLYFENLISFEFSGPGRVRQGEPARIISLARDESFAPETALLYDADTGLAFVESTMTSMGPGAIALYFGEFTQGTTYTLIPRADHEAAAKARRFTAIRSVMMRVSLGPTTEEDRKAGLAPVKAFASEYGAGIVDIVIKAQRPRDRSLILDRVQRLIDAVLPNDLDAHVEQLKVSGREHEDDPLDVIDLIQHHQRRVRQLEIDPDTRKIPHLTRWNELASIHKDFTRAYS